MTGTISPSAANSASGSAYGSRSASSSTKIAAPIIAERISCPLSHELIRRASRVSVLLLRERTSGG